MFAMTGRMVSNEVGVAGGIDWRGPFKAASLAQRYTRASAEDNMKPEIFRSA